MSLEIRHNRAEHAHENFQFRRIAKSLHEHFERKGWDGLLIGNPDSEDFSRFRADAILLYNHGLIIIDLKDYQGNIDLPPNEKDFKETPWYIDVESDRERILIKSGKRFVNPLKQLQSYRSVMFEVVKNSIALNAAINPGYICALNLFSGPIQINGKVPGKLRYYHIVEEYDLNNFLYDYNSENTYSQESANALKKFFPAPLFEMNVEDKEEEKVSPQVHEINGDVEVEITSFLNQDSPGVLVLESMEHTTRDDWMRYLLSESSKYHIPQIESWTHSSRIARKIKMRSGVSVDSLYNTIYGGKAKTDESEEKDIKEVEVTEEEENEDLLEIVPIKSDDLLDSKAVIILQDAHLVSRSLHQSDLLRFGSGRLLEDLIEFLNLSSTNRKLICIGDPYSLSYGKEEESAISIECLKDLLQTPIQHYSEKPNFKKSSQLHEQRVRLAKGIDDKLFNHLQYSWNDFDLINSEKLQVMTLLKDWFSNPLTAEPQKAVLFYSNDLAKKTNLWIKNNCIKNTAVLAKDDLLLLNNNVSVPDETGFGNPTRLYNGMYVLVKQILEEHLEPVVINMKTKQQVVLKFRKLKVQCLSIDSRHEVEIWLNDDYFQSNGKLSKEEQVALRILISKKLKSFKEKYTFDQSSEQKSFHQDAQYSLLRKQIGELKLELSGGAKVKGKLDTAEIAFRKLERKYKRRYNHRLLMELSSNDPILNAINATYGWCITVHKAVGSQFEEIIINATQGENRGVENASYYRWLYSGLTTAKYKAHVTNPIEIDPFMDCLFEDLVEEGWTEAVAKLSDKFEFKDFTIPVKYSDKLKENLIANAKAAICLFAERLEGYGVILSRTQKYGDYISKGFFSTSTKNKGDLVMVFNNDGKEKITSIRAERNGELLAKEIEDGINFIRSNSVNHNLSEINFPEDFRRPVYKNLIEKCTEEGCDLSIEKSHDYHDIFILSNGSNKIRFRLGYNGSGMFTHIKVIEKTNIEMSINLHKLFLNEE